MVTCIKRPVTVQSHYREKSLHRQQQQKRPTSVVERGERYDQLSDVGSDQFYKVPCGKGRVLFTGPDGVRDHQVKVLDPRYVGIGVMSREGTSELSYLWSAPMTVKHPQAKSSRVGEIGWNVKSYNDHLLLKSNHQIKLKEFRQLTEDRHTHLYQNPWTPHPASEEYKNDRYGREFTDVTKISQTKLTPNNRCGCLPSRPKTCPLPTMKRRHVRSTKPRCKDDCVISAWRPSMPF